MLSIQPDRVLVDAPDQDPPYELVTPDEAEAREQFGHICFIRPDGSVLAASVWIADYASQLDPEFEWFSWHDGDRLYIVPMTSWPQFARTIGTPPPSAKGGNA